MDKVYKMLMTIKDTPHLYIGSWKLEILASFIGGYNSCLHEMGEKLDFGYFNFFAAGYFNELKTTAGWRYLIDEHLKEFDDKKRMHKFYELLEFFYNKDWIDKAFEMTKKTVVKDDEFYNTFKRPEFIPESSFNVMIQLFNGYLLSNIEAGNFNIMEAMISFIRYIADDKIFDAKNWDKLITDEYGTEEEACNYFYNKLDEFYNKRD